MLVLLVFLVHFLPAKLYTCTLHNFQHVQNIFLYVYYIFFVRKLAKKTKHFSTTILYLLYMYVAAFLCVNVCCVVFRW